MDMTPSIAFRRWHRAIVGFLNVVVAVSALVGGGLFLDSFNSTAKIDFEIQHRNVTYDEEGILADFTHYGVAIPRGVWARRGTRVVMSRDEYDFRERNSVEQELQTIGRGHVNLDKELRDAIVYEFRDRSGARRELAGGSTTNRAFWESLFPSTLEPLVDTVTFHQAMRIVLSRRLVTVALGIQNSGLISAKDIEVTLQAPWLLSPRSFMTVAHVQFLEIVPDLPLCKVRQSGDYATLSIPFLEPGNSLVVDVTTTMTNLTRNNVFIDFVDASTLRPWPIIRAVLIGVLAIYLIPIAGIVWRRGKRGASVSSAVGKVPRGPDSDPATDATPERRGHGSSED